MKNDKSTITIELNYDETAMTPAGVKINVHKASVVDIILAWTCLTEKVISITNIPGENKSLTQFIGNTIRAYADIVTVEGADTESEYHE